jgi:ABC-type sugar transport system permease subunit
MKSGEKRKLFSFNFPLLRKVIYFATAILILSAYKVLQQVNIIIQNSFEKGKKTRIMRVR